MKKFMVLSIVLVLMMSCLAAGALQPVQQDVSQSIQPAITQVAVQQPLAIEKQQMLPSSPPATPVLDLNTTDNLKVETEIVADLNDQYWVTIYLTTSGFDKIGETTLVFKSSNNLVADVLDQVLFSSSFHGITIELAKSQGATFYDIAKIKKSAPVDSITPGQKTYFAKFKIHKQEAGNFFISFANTESSSSFQEKTGSHLVNGIPMFDYSTSTYDIKPMTPLTYCFAAGCGNSNCGIVNDGCEKALNCGTCAPGSSCIDNVCKVINAGDLSLCSSVSGLQAGDKTLVQQITVALNNPNYDQLQKLNAVVTALMSWLGI